MKEFKMNKFKLPKDLIIIDVETSGTDYNTSSIIQLGAIKFSADGYVKPQEFNKYIIPYTNGWEDSAFKVHKIGKLFLLEKGFKIEYVLRSFEEWAAELLYDLKKQYYLGQWACGFDTTFLQAAYKKANRKYPFHYRAFDIASIVRFYLATQGNLKGKKMGEVVCAKRLGIEVDESKQHDGLYDAQLAGRMLEEVIRRINK